MSGGATRGAAPGPRPRRLAPAVAVLGLLLLAACYSFRAAAGMSVRPGDTVRVTTYDGRLVIFEVVAVSPTELVGESERFAVDEIQSLEAYRFDLGQTLLMPFVAVGTVLGAAFYVVVSVPVVWTECE